MKSPRKANHIADYFVGVFPKDELDAMVDECVAQVLAGDGTSNWETLFENKVLVKQIQLEKEVRDELRRESVLP